MAKLDAERVAFNSDQIDELLPIFEALSGEIEAWCAKHNLPPMVGVSALTVMPALMMRRTSMCTCPACENAMDGMCDAIYGYWADNYGDAKRRGMN